MSYMSNEKKKELVINMFWEYVEAHCHPGYPAITVYNTPLNEIMNNTTIDIRGLNPTDPNASKIIIQWDEVTNCYETFNAIVSKFEERKHQAYKSMLNSTYGKAAASKPSGVACASWIAHCMTKDVIFNPPATIVFWTDGTKTVVKAHGEDEYDPEKGLAMAFSKKFLGNEYGYYNTFKHWLKKWDKQCEVPTDIQNFLEVIRAIGGANPLDVIAKELTNDGKDSDS